MAMVPAKESNDQKKMIIAVALGILAIIALWWTFFGFGSSQKAPVRNSNGAVAGNPPGPGRVQQQAPPQTDDAGSSAYLMPISLPPAPPAVAEARRNIFAFYEPPPPPLPRPSVAAATPTPTPPLLLASVSPASIYARTDDFTLEVTGDKFTPAVRIVIDNRELRTRFVSPQQLSATVPASIIVNPGQRQIVVRNTDGSLYSLPASLNVTAPPTPNYNYVGILGKPRHIGDTALLQDKNNKEVVSVQRGDIVGGRFRVTSIADREVVLIDTSLKIKHLLTLTNEGDKGSFPQGRPTPKVAAEDDEP